MQAELHSVVSREFPNLSAPQALPKSAAFEATLARYQALKPGKRQRDAAAALGLSEGELVAFFAEATQHGLAELPQVRRLDDNWDALVPALHSLGEVMALTRNAHAVIEVHGVYDNYERMGLMANVVGERIDLRLLFRNWHAAYAVDLPTSRGINPSIQIFDRHGDAVHKVFVGTRAPRENFDALVVDREAPAASAPIFEPASPAVVETPEASALLARASLLDAWSELKDTHDFFPMLRRLKLARHQALALAEGMYTRRVALDAHATVIKQAAACALEMMCFVSSRGVIEIFSGRIKQVKRLGTWFNVLDPHFNLHLDESAVAHAWVVSKPTVDGPVHSLEIYDAEHTLILQCFGLRKPGQPERPAWQQLLEAL